MLNKLFKNFYKKEYVEAEYRTGNPHAVISIGKLKIKYKISKLTEKNFSNKIKNCVAIIAPNGIGDYMLVRQYFKYIKKSPKYKNSNLILFQKKHYINFSKLFDNEFFIDIIAFNKNEESLATGIKNIIKKYEFDSVINLSARKIEYLKNEKLHLKLLKLIHAKEKIVDVLSNENNKNKIDKNISKIYTKFIYTNEKVFEIERRRNFFSKLLDMELPFENINLNTIFNTENKYIVFSLMAMNKNRMFPEEKWINIINYILSITTEDIKLIFIGSEIDFINTKSILEKINNRFRSINLCGTTDITILPIILKNSIFLISPETGTVHIAESVNCKTICLSSGAHYGRFLPHKNNIKYIYPPKFKKLIESKDKQLSEFYYPNYADVFSMEDIDITEIYDNINEFLKTYTKK